MDILGETADLNEFLFGSERASLAAVRPVLMDIQRGACFYGRSSLKPANTDVDHFIAWARYPVDLGHNFVLADRACNGKKRDRLPAIVHLAAWMKRNERLGGQIREFLWRSVGLSPNSRRRIRWRSGRTPKRRKQTP